MPGLDARQRCKTLRPDAVYAASFLILACSGSAAPPATSPGIDAVHTKSPPSLAAPHSAQPALLPTAKPSSASASAAYADPSASASDLTLLQQAEDPCTSNPVTTDAATRDPSCSDRRADALFELVSRWTTAADFAPPTKADLARFATACAAALHEDSTRLHSVVLASVAALAALHPDGRRALCASSLPTLLLDQLSDSPSDLLRARLLFALGALLPDLSNPRQREQKEAIHQQITEGMRHPSRFVFRQAVLAATLSGDDSFDADVIATLHRLLFDRHADDVNKNARAAAPALPHIPDTLSPTQIADLQPLLPSFIGALLQSADPAAAKTAEHLLTTVIKADPRSAVAHFLRAKVLDRKRDGSALPDLRAALSLGNLPSVFAAQLGPHSAELTPPIDLPAARRHVRTLLSHRTQTGRRLSPFLLHAADLDRADASSAQVPHVSIHDLEAKAADLHAKGDTHSEAALSVGRDLFRYYPFGSQHDYDSCLRSFLLRGGTNHDLLDALGLQVAAIDPPGRSATHEIVGVVQAIADAKDTQVDGANGAPATSYGVTCALCHTQIEAAGQRRDGLPTRTYDQGLLLAACIDQPIHYKAQNRNLDQLMTYLPGRNDSSSDGVHNPTEIPSLWGLSVHGPVRWNGDTPSLELQIDRNLSGRSAPPAVVLLVAAYLRSLGPQAATQSARHLADPQLREGRHVFDATCARCHEPPLYTNGRVIPLDVLDTDVTRISAVLPNSGDGYKVPTLLGIARTAPYLHDGSIAALDVLLDPHRSGGHRFGLSLPTADRRHLLRFLRTL